MVMQSAPLDDATFAALMDRFAPFEAQPQLAVAVSGGADSLALCLLADRWARGRGGAVVGLTVDHGLRPDAAAEAEQVGRWLAQAGIAHCILRWTGDKPGTGVQAAAREARYGLLNDWCRGRGILHLLLAHHADDQAETLMLRLARGSGVDGLSAMAPLSATPHTRLLRPVLDVPRLRLAATLQAMGQPWIDDPSNRNDIFKRVRLRRLMPTLAEEGLDAARLAATARHLGRARQALAAATADLLVEAVGLDQAGFAILGVEALRRATAEVSLRALAQLCRTIGGTTYPPRLERLERLHRDVLAGLTGRRTFAGCVLAPRAAGVLVFREPAAIDGPMIVRSGEAVRWDRRFTVRLSGNGTGQVAALGQSGWQLIRDGVDAPAIPSGVATTLPTLSDQHGICAVPHLGYKREMGADLTVDFVAFTPVWPLSGSEHCLV